MRKGAPLRSTLFADGRTTGVWIPGTRLVRQFSTERGFVLLTDYDAMFEETTSVILLDARPRAVSWRSLGVLFSFLPAHDTGFRVHGEGAAGRYWFQIRRHSMPYLFPRLAMRRVDKPEERA